MDWSHSPCGTCILVYMATATKPRTPQHKGRVTTSVRDAYAEVTKQMIAALKGGKIPWHKPWKVTGLGDAPVSLATGKFYRGINVYLLMLAAMDKGYKSNRWGTFNQMAELAGMVKVSQGNRDRWLSPTLEDGTVDPTPRGVRKGEKSTEIVFWRIIKKEEMVDGKKVKKTIPLLRIFHVFNMDQCEFPEGTRGAKMLAKQVAAPEVTPKERDEAAEALVAEYLENGPSLAHGGDSAHYVPKTDHIQMPVLDSFDTTEHYLSTLYHEITHSTGHETRLKRKGIAEGTFGGFGSKVYSEEELVAEMGASMLCAIAGIDQAAIFDNSVAYIQHWISKLEEDDKLIIRAAAQAQKAVDKVLGTTFADEDENAGEGVAA